MSSGLFTNARLLQDYYVSKVCHNLIPAIAFFDLVFFPRFGIDYFLGGPINRHLDASEAGFDAATWISPGNELKKFFRSVREIYREIYDVFLIGTNAKCAVG